MSMFPCSSPWFCVVVFVLRKGPCLAVCVARLLHNLARSSILRLSARPSSWRTPASKHKKGYKATAGPNWWTLLCTVCLSVCVCECGAYGSRFVVLFVHFFARSLIFLIESQSFVRLVLDVESKIVASRVFFLIFFVVVCERSFV